MVLPYETFEAIIKSYIDERKAEEGLAEGISKYADSYVIFEMPLTMNIIDILEKLYKDDSDYPLLSWWLFEGELNKETYENPEAKYWEENNKENVTVVKTIRDLYNELEANYKRKIENE